MDSPFAPESAGDDPICADLYCGLGGWAEGFLSEGYRVIGFDIVRHQYGSERYPGDLVLQDVLTIHGRQLRHAAVIVASPPCTEPSYRSMPWKRARALNEAGPPLLFISLFEACFRIQREASEAAARYIPMVVENVKGAQRWVGSARWHYGSFYLWGDVPALMPFSDGRKGTGGGWFSDTLANGSRPDWRDSGCPTRLFNSRSAERKRLQAEIAKVPFALAQHVAQYFRPERSLTQDPNTACRMHEEGSA